MNRNPKTTEGRSILPIEWTNQHGAGGNEDTNPNKLNANLVLQFLAQPVSGPGQVWDAGQQSRSMLRDGVETNRNDYRNPQSNLFVSHSSLSCKVNYFRYTFAQVSQGCRKES